jgi:hypothetical protein
LTLGINIFNTNLESCPFFADSDFDCFLGSIGAFLGGFGRTLCNIRLAVSGLGLRANGTEHYDGHASIYDGCKGNDIVRREQGCEVTPDGVHSFILFAIVVIIAALGIALQILGASYFTPRWCGEHLPTNKPLFLASIVVFLLGWILMSFPLWGVIFGNISK